MIRRGRAGDTANAHAHAETQARSESAELAQDASDGWGWCDGTRMGRLGPLSVEVEDEWGRGRWKGYGEKVDSLEWSRTIGTVNSMCYSSTSL